MKLHWSKHWLRNSRKYFQIPNVPWKCVGLVLLLPVSLLSNNTEVHIDQIHPSDWEILIVQSACEELFSENRFLWIKTKKDFCYKVDFILTYWKKSVINLFLCWLGSAFFFSISMQAEGLTEVFITFSRNTSFLSKMELNLTLGSGFVVNMKPKQTCNMVCCGYQVPKHIHCCYQFAYTSYEFLRYTY